MNKQFIGEIIDSLSEMIDYANDETLSRYDSDYKDYFNSIDKANEILVKLNELYEKESE